MSDVPGETRQIVMAITAQCRVLGDCPAAARETAHLLHQIEPHDGDRNMKKLILACIAFTSLTTIGSAPASAQMGCTTQWVNGKISQVCNSAVGARVFPTPYAAGQNRNVRTRSCYKPLGFNQPYVCN
jgi:hypothetical protein